MSAARAFLLLGKAEERVNRGQVCEKLKKAEVAQHCVLLKSVKELFFLLSSPLLCEVGIVRWLRTQALEAGFRGFIAVQHWAIYLIFAFPVSLFIKWRIVAPLLTGLLNGLNYY